LVKIFRFAWPILLGLAIAATEIPGATPAAAIIQGNATSPATQFPWVGWLHGQVSGGEETCTSSLVDRSWAITAAHCFNSSDKLGNFQITFDYYDQNDLTATGVSRGIDGVYQYFQQDVALVHLTNPIDSIDPVTLAKLSDSSEWRKGAAETIVGWGNFAIKNGDDHNLRWANHVVVDPSATLVRGTIRTQPAPDSSGEWAYHGDSGGPLLYLDSATGLYTQVGVFTNFWGGTCVFSHCFPVSRNWSTKIGRADVENWLGRYLRDQGTSVPWNSAAGDSWTSSGAPGGLAELTYGHGGCEAIDPNAQCTGGTWPVIPGAPYIWAHRLTQGETTVTFKKTFRVTSQQAATPMQLTAWADDNYTASLNGSAVLSGSFDDMPGVVAVNLHAGMNTIEITVNNIGAHDSQNNPAGLAWKITPASSVVSR
jgi:hypothetical protein